MYWALASASCCSHQPSSGVLSGSGRRDTRLSLLEAASVLNHLSITDGRHGGKAVAVAGGAVDEDGVGGVEDCNGVDLAVVAAAWHNSQTTECCMCLG